MRAFKQLNGRGLTRQRACRTHSLAYAALASRTVTCNGITMPARTPTAAELAAAHTRRRKDHAASRCAAAPCDTPPAQCAYQRTRLPPAGACEQRHSHSAQMSMHDRQLYISARSNGCGELGGLDAGVVTKVGVCCLSHSEQ